MKNTDPRIDAYIEKMQPFAQEILRHLRSLVHEACPDVEETWKWSFPHFDYRGAMMCSMAGFKEHCAFTFWKASVMSDPHNILEKHGRSAMGHLGRIKSLNDLPPDDVLKSYIREAMALNENDVKLPPRPKPAAGKDTAAPEFFLEALEKNPAAQENFEKFPPSAKKDYILWLEEAKTEGTREKRLATAIEWIAEGKKRHWKYETR